MFPVCSATTSCSCNTQIPMHGALKSFFPYLKTVDFNCNNVDKVVPNFSSGAQLDGATIRKHLVSYIRSSDVGNSQPGSSNIINIHPMYQSRLGNIAQLNQSSYQIGIDDKSGHLESNGMIFVESSTSVADYQPSDIVSNTIDNTDILPNYVDPELTSSFSGLPIDPPIVSDSFGIDVSSTSGQETSFADIISGLNEAVADTLPKGVNVLDNSFETINTSVTKAITDANKTADNVINDIVTFIHKSGESAANKFSGISSGLKEASGKTGVVALDVLRQTVVIVEDSLSKVAGTVGYAYNASKEFLPPEFQETLNLSEETVMKVLRPVGATFQEVYVALGRFEENLGLDPNDPLIPLVLFLGLSATLWSSYRIIQYSGYAGDLSPESVLELLRRNEDVVLIDIRPENLRERDGIPDLRRAARSRYASVTLPEVDGSVKKLLKGGRAVEDFLLAAVIRNLKIVQDRSKVLVMDADGTRTKGVARSLRKLGTKSPYLVQGGFRSWVEEGFRVKELKPETALTILNEDAEAILEEIKPTPLKLIAFGVGLAGAVFSLLGSVLFISSIIIFETRKHSDAHFDNFTSFKEYEVDCGRDSGANSSI